MLGFVGIGSFAAGTLFGYFIKKETIKKRYEKELDEKLKEAYEMYEEETINTIKSFEDYISLEKNPTSEPEEKEKEESSTKTEIKMDTKIVRYDKMFPDEIDEEITPEEEANIEHEQNRHRKPKIISAKDSSILGPHIEERELDFYAYNETLVDAEEDEILEEEDIERLIGDALTKYNFIDSDETEIYVMNYEIDVCFKIIKKYASY